MRGSFGACEYFNMDYDASFGAIVNIDGSGLENRESCSQTYCH